MRGKTVQEVTADTPERDPSQERKPERKPADLNQLIVSKRNWVFIFTASVACGRPAY